MSGRVESSSVRQDSFEPCLFIDLVERTNAVPSPCRLPSADAIAFSEMDRYAPEDDDVEEEQGSAAEEPRPTGEHGALNEEIVQARSDRPSRHLCILTDRMTSPDNKSPYAVRHCRRRTSLIQNQLRTHRSYPPQLPTRSSH